MFAGAKESIKNPNKERILAALKGEIPDRVPNFEACIEGDAVKRILKKDAGSTVAASRGASDEALKEDG